MEYRKPNKKTLSYIGAGLLALSIPVGMITSCVMERRYVNNEVNLVLTGIKKPFVERLHDAKEVMIVEELVSFGKRYNIYADNEWVANVDGKAIPILGDTFTLLTLDDQVLAKESEDKRLLFKWNRSATFYSADEKITGHLGEERLHDFFTLGYVFHFYDQNKNEIGKSQKIGRSFISLHYIYDTNGKTDYSIDKRFSFLRDTFVVTTADKESAIPLEQVILLTCIEDAIADSEKKKDNESSSKSSSNSRK